MTATQAAERLSQNVWVKMIIASILVCGVPMAFYGKNYLDQRFDTVDRRFVSVEEKLSAAAAKDKADDGTNALTQTRISILENTMQRGREDRERFQRDTAESLKSIQLTQLETAKAISSLLATIAEMNRQSSSRRQ